MFSMYRAKESQGWLRADVSLDISLGSLVLCTGDVIYFTCAIPQIYGAQLAIIVSSFQEIRTIYNSI